MTRTGDGSEDPGDTDFEHWGQEEVHAELARVATEVAEWRRIELRARIWVRGTTIDWRDLVHTVVERLLTREGEHRRRWHREEAFAACFDRTMKSIVRDHWRRERNPIIPIDEAAAGLRDVPDPERKTLANNELDEILTALDDDKHTKEIALARAMGDSPTEIRQRLNLTETDYDTALKRIRRLALKRRTPGA